MKRQRKFSSAVKAFWQALRTAVAEHPAEMLMLLYCGVLAGFSDVLKIEEAWKAQPGCMMPLLVVAAYSLQPLRKRSLGWRLLYWLPVVLAAAVWRMPFLDGWCHSESFYFLVFACLPLWLLVRNLVFENEPFARCAARMVSSAAYALVITGAVFFFYWLIIESVQLLFISGAGSDKLWEWNQRVVVFLFAGVAPMLFIAFEERKHEFTVGKLLHVLINWVLTPALLVYTVILYVYSAKILVTMSLPRGSVAVMVLVFCLVAMAAQMAQQLCEKRPFRWFYDHFSWFALPLQVLFWIAVSRRLSDYGITPSRYALILCGFLMTLFVVLFLFRNRRGYFIIVATALVFTLVPVLISPLGPKSLSRCSQEHRVRTAAAKLGILDPDGKLALPRVSDTVVFDSSEYANARLHRAVYQSLRYLEDDDDTTYLQRTFGLKHSSDYLGFLSVATSSYATAYRVSDDEDYKDVTDAIIEEEYGSNYRYLWNRDKYEIDISSYNTCWCGEPEITEEGVVFPFGVLPHEDLMSDWFDSRGVSRTVSGQWLDAYQEELMFYKNDTMLVIFSRLDVVRDSVTNEWGLERGSTTSSVQVFRTAKFK